VTSLAAFGVRKPVVVNLLMILLLGAGAIFGMQLRREFFPEVRSNLVVVTAPYPGAAPEEIESSLAIKIEDRIADIDDVEEVTTTVTEGAAMVMIEFAEGTDIDVALQDVKREIDSLQDLPEESERIIVDKLEPNLPVINLSLYGDAEPRIMKAAINQIRDDLRTLPGMGDVAISGVRTNEISVEVRPESALEHRLSLPAVAQRVREHMIELPSGTVRSASENVAIRTLGADDVAEDVRGIVVKAGDDGQVVRLGEIAEVRDSFEDVDLRSRLNGKPAVSLTVFKVGEQDAVDMAALVKAYRAGRVGEPIELTARERLAKLMRRPGTDEPVSARVEAHQLGAARFAEGSLPGELVVTTDLARFIVGRLDLLTRNAKWGGLLVFLTLVLLLNWRTSLWVALGLVISLAGTLAVMHLTGITLNLLTMFGLIVVIGLLVDDAIVVAENITSRHERGEPALLAAVNGTNQVGWPVIATVLTTICAFLPLSLIQGRIGDMLGALPVVVACALLVSLFEALLILPTHVGHALVARDRKKGTGKVGHLQRLEFRFDTLRDGFLNRWLIPNYTRFLARCIRRRYLTLVASLALLIVSIGMIAGGRLQFIFFEMSDSETVNVELRMPVGTPIERTDEVIRRVEAACQAQPEVLQVFATAGAMGALDGTSNAQQAHLAQLILELAPVEQRDRSSEQVIEAIRNELGEMPGVKSLRISPVAGGPEGVAITLTVAGDGPEQIMPVVERISSLLGEYDGVYDIADDADAGQKELRLTLRDGASELGFTVEGVARQVRGALYGLEAHTFAGNREDVDVRVMYPEAFRRSLAAVESMFLFSPAGNPVPLSEVVRVDQGFGYATIRRLDRRRTVTVTAEVERSIANPEYVMAALRPELARMDAELPQVRILERGRQKEMAESFSTLPLGMGVAAGLIYVILAWLFSSYTQPVLVMLGVPFAIIGLVWGHIILGFTMTFLSLIGFIALAGVVVNDSLIFMEFFNHMRRAGWSVPAAALRAGHARFRPIMLTTLTTVLGLLPLMLERSFQARFLIPMAITISFGLMSATGIILLVLPCLLVIFEDVKRTLRTAWRGQTDA
jgi:HAE1 family hydrophobic/amphiphilic exporter-1